VLEVNGKLYGTTSYGGNSNGCDYGCGTLYSLDPTTGTENVTYSFCVEESCLDGSFPSSGLIEVNGMLYGTTYYGGSGSCSSYYAGCGTVFGLDVDTGTEAVLHSFCSQQNCADGENPLANVVAVNGILYGTTYAGGSSVYYGTVFALDPGTGVENVLHSFCSQIGCADGAYPLSGLTNVEGELYGTTSFGGSAGKDCTTGIGCGTVFAIDPDSGDETIIYSFCRARNCNDGNGPGASMIDVKGKLYGTTTDGGKYEYGTVFVVKKP